MSHTKLRSVLGSILLGIGVMVASAGSSAAVFRGTWDPSFGAPYPDLGWRGFADFFVDDACLDSTGWFEDGDCGEMSLLAATVELYDASVLSPAPTLDTVVFAPPPVVPDPVLGVFIGFDPTTGMNELMGVDTTIFGPEIGNTGGSPPIYWGQLWLEFVSGQMPPPIFSFTTLDAVPNGAFLHACATQISNEPRLCGEPEVRATTPGVITFTRIPEPGSLVLLFGAFAGWLVRRQIRGC